MGVGWKERRGWPWISLPCLLQKKPPPPHRQEGTVPSARCQPITQVLRWARLNCQEFGTDARPVQRQSPAVGRQVGGLQTVGEEVAAAPAPRRPSEPASSRLLEQSLGKRRREGVPPSRAFPRRRRWSLPGPDTEALRPAHRGLRFPAFQNLWS